MQPLVSGRLFLITVVITLVANSTIAVLPAWSQSGDLSGVLMSGSGEGGFSTSNISLYNPDVDRLYNVSVTPHLWRSTQSGTDSLGGLHRGTSSLWTSSNSWNPSLSSAGRMVFVVDWLRGSQDGYNIVAQNRDATERVVLAGPFPGGGSTHDSRRFRPSISPDGQTVIYTVSDGQGGELYRVPADGSAPPERFHINDPHGCNVVVQAVFSPDGSEIAFLGQAPQFADNGTLEGCVPGTRVMGADGANLRTVHQRARNATENRWHPHRMLIDWKADRILFTHPSQGPLGVTRYEVGVVDASTGEAISSRNTHDNDLVPSSLQLSPDGKHLAYARIPSGQCWITVEDVETREVILDLTNVQDTGQYCYLNWADAPPVPEPARYELSETEIVLWIGQSVRVTPTLYDAQGNVIVHEARRFTETVPANSFRVNRLEHMYYGWTANATNQRQCVLNAGLEACFIVWNAESPIFRAEALVDTLYEATGAPGYVRIYRIGNPRPVSVNLQYRSGSAAMFRDFVLDNPSSSLSFPPGVYERNIRITPIENGVVTANRVARIHITTGLGYSVYTSGASNQANITIIDSGITTTDLAVTGASPARGASRGTVELKVSGRAFRPGASLFLERGGMRIPATDLEIDDRYLQRSLSGRVDLRNQSLGMWDVVVESGGERAVLANAFEIIESPAEPAIYSAVLGTTPVVSPRISGFTQRVRITNGGDSDIYDVMAHIWVTPGVEATVQGLAEFDDADFHHDAPVFYDRGDYQIAPLWIYRLPANETIEIPVHILVPLDLVGWDVLVGVTHNAPNSDHDFTWTGLLDHENEVLPWNLFVALARYGYFADEFGETAGKALWCPSPPAPPVPPGDPDCEGFGDSGPPATDADRIFDLYQDLGNDQTRFFDATVKIQQYGMQKLATSFTKRFLGPLAGCAANWALSSMTGIRNDKDFAAQLGFTPGGPNGGGGAAGAGGSGGGGNCSSAVASYDPNDKLSLPGHGEGRHLEAVVEMPYLIRFENMASATAPAQVVVVTDTLDTALFDINTFRLGAIEVADEVVADPPYGLTSFTTTIDRRPDFDHRLHIHAQLDRDDDESFARVTWIITTLDPTMDDLPENPMEGFLPPNVNAPDGEGSVQFYIRPHDHLPHGREISNHAEIVFDSNPPIVTPVWTNTLDFSPPTSAVIAVERTETDGVWSVEWDGSDSGAGIREFGIFVQKDDGPFELWTVSRATSELFEGDPDAEYGFFAMSIDWVGNVEDGKTRAEVTTSGPVSTEKASELPRVHALHANYPNPFNPSTVVPFDMPEAGPVRLQVFDLLGRHVETIIDADVAAGRHVATFDASRHASGIYLIRITTGPFTATRQVTLVK